MKPARFEYFAPTTVIEAVELRGRLENSALLAGGQSLLPILNFRLAQPEALIDLGRIEGLAGVMTNGGAVDVGAMTRQRDLELDESVREVNPLIRDTLQLVAHTVIRNRGTVGGSIAHADPAAELPALLLCLDGSVTVRGADGERQIPARELFTFHFTTSLEPSEILVAVRFPTLGPRTGWSFQEAARRHGDYALAGVCCTITVGEDGTCTEARLAACGVASTPVRLEAAEQALTGSRLDAAALDEAGALSREAVDTPDDVQASTRFRQRLVHELVKRTTAEATARAGS